jgi:hypothetical protein
MLMNVEISSQEATAFEENSNISEEAVTSLICGVDIDALRDEFTYRAHRVSLLLSPE